MKELTPFERRIEIVKLLHGKEVRTGELAEHFGVDDRTIRTDIVCLREGMDILGTKIKIESKHDGSQRHYYKSTVHPIFLSLNLSELFGILKALENKSKEVGGEVYKNIFQKIYSQMTDYAENKISPLLEDEYNKTQIINTLEEEVFNKDNKLVYWGKSGRYIEVSYTNEENKQVKEEIKLVNMKGNELEIENKDGKKRWIDYTDIIIDWENQEYK